MPQMGAMHMSNSKAYEVQRTNNFELTIEGLSQDVTLLVESATLPSISVEPMELSFGNSKVKVAGSVTYEDSEIVVKDAVYSDTEGQLYNWFCKTYNPETDQIGDAADYKRTARLTQYSPGGTNPRVWKLEGVWISNYSSSDYSYEGADKKTITMTLSVDKATIVR